MAPTLRRSRALAGLVTAAAAVVAMQARDARGDAAQGASVPAATAAASFVDVHTHLARGDPGQAVRAALAAMPREHAARLVFLPPPFTADDPGRYDAELLLPAITGHADRLAAFGGGGTLNPLIQESVHTGDAGRAVRERFRRAAEQLLRDGVAGFGEIAVEHFPGATPYQSAPPDHPLLLLLADVAAEHGVPIDLHMEAVTRPMSLPDGAEAPAHRRELTPNVEAFERLLSHDPRARIVWAHAGWDNTGARTPALCRRLLRAHPNLFMDVKLDPARPGRNPPLRHGTGDLDPEWLQLFRDFPDRFVVGTDQHYPEPSVPVQRWQAMGALLERLPPDLRRSIGTENAARLLSGERTPRP